MNKVTRTLMGALMLLGSLYGVSPDGLAAQDATLTGIVFDSTSMEALAGARVAVIGTMATTDADESGRFTLEGIPAGTHWVSFYHSRLQSLGVSPPSRQVVFGAGEDVQIELAVPSDETLLLGWCLAEQPGPRYAALAGQVTDSLTGVPMPRADVLVTPVDRRSLLRPIEVKTDDSGYFRVCAFPAGQLMKVQARFGQNTGTSVQLMAEEGAAYSRDLVLLMSAEGILSGYVRDYLTGEPIVGATVTVLGTTSGSLTDGEGRFFMDDLPPGRHLITTDHLAFAERTDSVTVFSQETVDIEVRMAAEALEVEGLVVTARTRFGRTSLAGEAKRADFISREDIETLLPRVSATADLLRNMNAPGLRVRDIYVADELTGAMTPSLCVEVSRRQNGSGCRPAAVFINGVIVPYPESFLRDLDPNIIDRIEVLSAVDAQFQFGSLAGNGAIVIFTR